MIITLCNKNDSIISDDATSLPYSFGGNSNTGFARNASGAMPAYHLVFRTTRSGGLEAAIRATMREEVRSIDGSRQIHIIQSYRSLTGEAITLWVKRADDAHFIKTKRSGENDDNAAGRQSSRTMVYNCNTYFFTDSYWYCYGVDNGQGGILGEVICEMRYRTGSYEICGEGEPQTEIDWIADDDVGGGPPDGHQPDPCATAQAQTATSLAATPIFSDAKSEIQAAAASDGKEHGISFGKDVNGNLIRSSMSTGTATNGTTPSISNKFADIHNHQDNKPPSSVDIYGFIDRVIASPDFNTRFVLTVNGDVYALVITDRQAAITFNQNYPQQPGVGGMEPMFPDDIVDEIEKMEGWGGASKEMATAFILEKYDTGISLLKTTITGNFKKLKTAENIDNKGNKSYHPNNCQ